MIPYYFFYYNNKCIVEKREIRHTRKWNYETQKQKTYK